MSADVPYDIPDSVMQELANDELMLADMSDDAIDTIRSGSVDLSMSLGLHQFDVLTAIATARDRKWSMPDYVLQAYESWYVVTQAEGHDRGCLPDGAGNVARYAVFAGLSVAVLTGAKLPKTVRAKFKSYSEFLQVYWGHVHSVCESSDY